MTSADRAVRIAPDAPPVPQELAAPAGAVRDSMAVSVWTAVSRLTGLARGVVVAGVLGATHFANSYQYVNSLPNLIFYGVLAGSLFTSLLVPALVRHLDRGDRAGARAVAGGLLGAVFGAMFVVLPVAVAAAPAVLAWNNGTGDASGGLAAQAAADQARTGLLLVLLLMPQVPLYAVIGTATAVMNAQRRFALPAAAPALENLGTIAVLAAVAVLHPDVRTVQQPSIELLLLLGLGTTGAVAVHAGVQWLGARRAGVSLRPALRRGSAEVRDLIRRAVPALCQSALAAGQILVLISLANRLAGGVVAVQLALNFFYLPIALAATPVMLSLAPRLARMIAPGQAATFRATLTQGLCFALFLTIPAATAYLALAQPISRAISVGAFDAGNGAPLVASALFGLAAGLVGETVFMIATCACYARGDTGGPLRAGVVQAVVFLCCAGVATALLAGPSLLAGLGGAYSIAALLGAALLLRRVFAELPAGPGIVIRCAARDLVLSLLMATPAVVVSQAVARAPLPGAGVLAVLAGAVAGGLVYLGLQAIAGAPELTWVLGAVGGRRREPWPARRGLREILWRPRVLGDAGTLLVVLAFGALVVAAPVLAGGVLVALTLAVAVWAAPVRAAYLIIVITPLTAGIDRGRVLPLLRPNEALLFLLVAVVGVRLVLTARSGSLRLPVLSTIEKVLLGMAVASSVLPLLVMWARSRPIDGDDLNHAIVLWKLLLSYALVRVTVTTRAQIATCLGLLMASSVVVSAIAVLQSLGLLGIPGLLAHHYAPFGVEGALSIGRGSSTLSLPAAVADLATLSVLIAVALLVLGSTRRRLLIGVAAVSVLGVVAAAEFSTLFGLVVALACLVMITRAWRLLLYAPPFALLGAVLLEPVIATRLAGFQSPSGIPVSWIGRLHNLQNYFWPDLFSQWNWVFGVRPSARVPSSAQEFGWIWIESGYTWLLWGGGIPLLLAYGALVVATVRQGLRLRASPSLPARAAGVGAACFMVANSFVMIFDPHITYRGAAEALLTLLALVTVAQTLERSEPAGQREGGEPEQPPGAPPLPSSVMSFRSRS